jgi:hypothetical protein
MVIDAVALFSDKLIVADLIRRTADGSDAVACSKVCPCCLPKCVGVQFWLIAVTFQVLGLYLALVWMLTQDL